MLLLECILLALCVVTGSYLHPDGFLSPDSASYLALANHLLDHNDFTIAGFGFTGNQKDYFAIWPVAYPVFIAILAKITGLSVFWSSKCVNILAAAFSLLLLRHIFNKTAPVYGLVFLFASTIVIASFSWSEPVFIFAMLSYALAFANFLQNTKITFRPFVILVASSLLLFLTRYIGAFCIITTLALAVYIFFKHKKPDNVLWLLAAGTINAAFVAAYLYHNLTQSNYLTGMPRIPAPETSLQLLQQLAIAMISELVIPIPHLLFRPEFLFIVVLQLAVIIYFFRFDNRLKNNNTATDGISLTISTPKKQFCMYSVAFFITGTTYLVVLIILRWTTHFDDFFFRLLAPGTLLIYIAGIRHLEVNFPLAFQQLKKVLVCMTGFTVCLVPVAMMTVPAHSTYKETLAQVNQRYAVIPSGSVVAFASIHARYLRDDLLLWSPLSLPYSNQQETWQAFLTRVGKDKQGNSRAIYMDNTIAKTIDNSNNIAVEKYDASVLNVIRQHTESGMDKIQ